MRRLLPACPDHPLLGSVTLLVLTDDPEGISLDQELGTYCLSVSVSFTSSLILVHVCRDHSPAPPPTALERVVA